MYEIQEQKLLNICQLSGYQMFIKVNCLFINFFAILVHVVRNEKEKKFYRGIKTMEMLYKGSWGITVQININILIFFVNILRSLQ